MELRKQKKKTSTNEASDAKPPSIVTEEVIRARFRNRVVGEIVESGKRDIISQSVLHKIAEVKITKPEACISDQAIIVSASTSTPSPIEAEVSVPTSSSTVQLSAAVSLLTTTLASLDPIDSDATNKQKLDLGETLMPWRLRPISLYMTYIPTPKAKLEKWREDLRERDAQI
ncbi:hypothetical protein TKK_0017011 [Trichogramma kaykai]|uniref:Uncharacterized protein n=1 Tax=Trichogramma kaykai TaxID=54128 RepID=A0ABD2W511_9HYME